MVKAVGLDAGEFEVKVVELDGSYRKPKLTKVNVDRVSQLTSSAANLEHASTEATALQHAVKAAHLGKQNVCLGFSTREALLRQLQVPFTGEDRIRKVIKFEAEGEIHSQSVDDMVIDFHTVEELGSATRVLVAGVPKQPLRNILDALEKVGIEPERVDLDSMGLYRVADWAGALRPAERAEGDADPKSRLVLDIGARAVVILVVQNGRLLDMRAIPLGCDSIAEDLSSRYGVDLERAREAMISCLATGEDFDLTSFVEVKAVDDDEESDEVQAPETGAPEAEEGKLLANSFIPNHAVEDARNRFLQRLRREFMRFLVAVKGIGDIEAAITTGAGSLLPGMHDLLAESFGCEPEPLSYMHNLQHSLSEEEVEYMEPRIAVAVGLALGFMNGVKGFNFRQEDLIYTRGFDRIKLPLAIACMLGLFYLFFHGVGLRKQLQTKERLYGTAMDATAKGGSTRRVKGQTIATYKQFTGKMLYLVNEGYWPERNMNHNEYRAMVNRLAEKPVFERLAGYRTELKAYLRKVQKKAQYEPSLLLDSGVAVLEQFSGAILSVEKQLGRFYIGELDLKLPPKEKGRQLDFRVFFRGRDFRERNVLLKAALQKVMDDKSSAFSEFTKQPVENPVSGEDVGCYYNYFLTIRYPLPVQKL